MFYDFYVNNIALNLFVWLIILLLICFILFVYKNILNFRLFYFKNLKFILFCGDRFCHIHKIVIT